MTAPLRIKIDREHRPFDETHEWELWHFERRDALGRPNIHLKRGDAWLIFGCACGARAAVHPDTVTRHLPKPPKTVNP